MRRDRVSTCEIAPGKLKGAHLLFERASQASGRSNSFCEQFFFPIESFCLPCAALLSGLAFAFGTPRCPFPAPWKWPAWLSGMRTGSCALQEG